MLNDFFNQEPEEALNPIQRLLDRNKQVTSEIEKLQSTPAPKLADPVADDELEPLSSDLLRGFFRSGIPNPDTPDFGKVFRQSVTPGRELLANMFNGMSSSMLGTKFQSVREQAFEKFATEQKLKMEQQQLRQVAMIQMAQVAQHVMQQRGEDRVRAAVEQAKLADNAQDRAENLLKAKQESVKTGIELEKFLRDEDREQQKLADVGPPEFKVARRAVEARLKLNNVDLSSPAGQYQLVQESIAEWQKIESAQAKMKGEPRPNVPSGLISAVLNNPSLFENLTPSARTAIAPELAKLGFEGFGKTLADSAVTQLSQSRNSLTAIQELRETLTRHKDLMGPLKGLQAMNPFNVRARTAQAGINLTRQRVGKALEGGVLRKEGEDKYKTILNTLTDQPETAFAKLELLERSITNDINNFINEAKGAGRNVSGVERAAKSSTYVKVQFPNGQTRSVPESEVSEATSKFGGKRVN